MVISSTSQYLTPEIVAQCFEKGRVHHVDKTVCGNGFTTNFLQIEPPEGTINVLIAPNKQVLIDKHRQYERGEIETPNRVGFYYAETRKNFENRNVLCFVADTFLNYIEQLKAMKERVNWILLDEYHAIEQQSAYRERLKNFLSNLSEFDTVTTVTATPNHGAPITITIEPEKVRPTFIETRKDRAKVVKEIQKRIEKGQKVVVFSQDIEVFRRIAGREKRLSAKLVIGETLLRKLVQRVVIEWPEPENPRLILCSSKGFEGHDIRGKGWHVYYFEDRTRANESFLISNLYQAVSRVREGDASTTYCRQERNTKRHVKTLSEVQTFLDDPSKSIETKMGKAYSHLNKYLVFRPHGHTFKAEINESLIRLDQEHILFDNGAKDFEFLKFRAKRRILINETPSEQPTRLQKRKRDEFNLDEIKNVLRDNAEIIRSLDLFGENFKLNYTPSNITARAPQKTALRELQMFLTCRDFDGMYQRSNNENNALEILQSDREFNSFCIDLEKTQREHLAQKHGVNSKKYREQSSKLKSTTRHQTARVLLAFLDDSFRISKKVTANRDYNVLTEISLNALNKIAERIGITLTEIDVRSCNPRIIYALAGESLPRDFYGENKRFKKGINVLLNSFRYDPKKALSKAEQRKYAVRRFRYYNVSERVISYLMDEWFEAPHKDNLFNFLAYHEGQIIRELRRFVKSERGQAIQAARRHDSLIFRNDNLQDIDLSKFNFLGVKGWFDSTEKQPLQVVHNREVFQKSHFFAPVEFSLKSAFTEREKVFFEKKQVGISSAIKYITERFTEITEKINPEPLTPLPPLIPRLNLNYKTT